MRRPMLALCALVAWSGTAVADKYQITPAEKYACGGDAERLCLASYPDEDKLMSCMEANRASLSTGCGVVFDAGMKRRHLY